MSKRPHIVLKHEDVEFISDYLSKHGIHKWQMCEIDPPYENYDVTIETIDDDNQIGNAMYTKFRWQTLPSKGSLFKRAKVYARFFLKDRLLEQMNIKFSWYIIKNEEEYRSLKANDNDIDGLVSMWELLGLSKERVDNLKKQYLEGILPCLLIDVEECSKNLKDKKIEDIAKKGVQIIIDQHCMIGLFLAYFKPEILKYQQRVKNTDVLEGNSNKKSSSASKKKKKKSLTELTTVIPMSKFVQDVMSNKLKLPRRKCPYAFQVRGHWSEYKSGKRVRIKEFTKGDKTRHKKQTVVLGKRKER